MKTVSKAARFTLFPAAFFILALTGVPKLNAQTETGQITGTVLDAQGGVLNNATVNAVDNQTKTTRTSKTSSGVYVLPSLPSGTYQVTVTAPGFETSRQTVTVALGTKVGLDFHLNLGSVQTIVEVSELASQVNTENQTVGGSISGNEIVNLPTITRNPYDLVKTVGNTTDSDPGGADRGVGVSINGLRSSDVGILLDGVPNVNKFDTTVAIKTPLDSVGEFQVLTSGFTAEYGRALAGVVNVDTKRGTSSYHGTVYEFNRVSALTSNTFDNNANAIPISPFTRNQFGFSVGGPVKKDKLFVFANPEWLRVRSNAIVTADIATPQLIAASAPATRAYFNNFGKQRSGLTFLQTFSYGQVCTSAAICTLLPANTPAYQKVAYSVPADSGGGSPQDTFLFAGRVDYNLSNNTQLYFRYARFDSTFAPGTVVNSPYAGYDTAQIDSRNSYVLSMTHIFSPTLVNQTKLSYNRVSVTQPLAENPLSPTLFTTLSSTNTQGGAAIVYPGYCPFTPGNCIPSGGPQNYYQINNDWTKVSGKHNLRFGGSFTYLEDDHTFGAYAVAVEALGTNKSTAVNGFINGLAHDFQGAIYPQGKFPCHFTGNGGSANIVVTPDCTLTLPVGPPNFSRSNLFREVGLYVQDSWKLTRRLTLNMGLRWEYFSPQTAKNPQLDSNFFFGPGSNIQTQAATGKVFLSTDPANPLGGLWAKDWHDFSPRLGFAYDLFGNGKTSLRGGWGLGYEPNFGNVTFNVIQNPPNYSVVALTAGSDVPTIPITTSPAGPLAGASGSKPLGRVTLRAVDPYIATAYAHLWSAALEHQFSGDLIVAAEYTGSKGVDLYTIDRVNTAGTAIVYAGTGGRTTRINNQYGNINFRTNGGFSHYNGLNLRADLRNFRRQGLTLRFNYTWSHALDNLSTTFSESNSSPNLGVLDPLNPGLDKGSADFDVRHRATVAAIWAVPFKSSNKIANAIIGGWNIIPNFSARTGTPFSAYDCTNANVSCPRAMYDNPFTPTYNVVPTANPNEFNYMSLGTPNSSYANPLSGFSDFGPFPQSMIGRNSFVTPGIWNLDFAVHKNFKISERFTMQLRAEAFNVFNHSNLYIVYGNTDVSGTSFITANKGIRADNNAFSSVSTDNRNLQLALKVLF